MPHQKLVSFSRLLERADGNNGVNHAPQTIHPCENETKLKATQATQKGVNLNCENEGIQVPMAMHSSRSADPRNRLHVLNEQSRLTVLVRTVYY